MQYRSWVKKKENIRGVPGTNPLSRRSALPCAEITRCSRVALTSGSRPLGAATMATLIARTVLQSGLEGEIEIPRLWSLISPRRVFRNVFFSESERPGSTWNGTPCGRLRWGVTRSWRTAGPGCFGFVLFLLTSLCDSVRLWDVSLMPGILASSWVGGSYDAR